MVFRPVWLKRLNVLVQHVLPKIEKKKKPKGLCAITQILAHAADVRNA